MEEKKLVYLFPFLQLGGMKEESSEVKDWSKGHTTQSSWVLQPEPANCSTP